MTNAASLQSPLAQLVTKMKGWNSTNGWDVVTSYSVEQLNAFIKDQYATMATDIETIDISQSVYDSDCNVILTYEFSFTLTSPVLEFTKANDRVKICMSFGEGSFYRIITPWGKKRKEHPFPSGSSLEAVLPINVMRGTIGSLPADESEDTTGKRIFTFTAGEESSYDIVLSFQSKEATFTLASGTNSPDKVTFETLLLIALEQYFQSGSSVFSFRLAGINNYKPASGSTLLTPKSFAFAICDQDGAGCLSLYIQTEQSGNGPGNATPSFQPGDTACSPIPEDYEASLIFSNSLMRETILSPQLKNENYSMKGFKDTEEGIEAELIMQGTIFACGESGTDISSYISYGGLSIDMSASPFLFSIHDGEAALQWQGSTSSSWAESTAGASITPYGSVTVNINIDRNGALAVTDTNLLFPQFTFAQFYTGAGSVADGVFIHVSPQACPFMQKGSGCREYVPGFYVSEMQIQIPDIVLTLPGFDFFLETNLLAPGQKMINLDSEAGVQTPHDFLIVGKIA